MMAARSIGFDGYGRKSQSEGFLKEFPVLLQPDHPEYQEVQELLRRTSYTFHPVWQNPIASHHRADITSVAFGPDGQTLISGSWDKTIKLWELATGRELKYSPESRPITHQLQVVTAARFGPCR